MNRERFDIQYAAIRRDVIERSFMHLNPMQQEAVYTTEGPLLILAGAGSGKTTVLINRIANIMRFGRAYADMHAPADADADALAELVDYLDAPDAPLTERIRTLCAVEPATAWSILAITFTNKAAAELRERLERMLGPGALDIWASTFHACCVRILRRDGERIGFDRNFTIYDDGERQSVLRECLRDLNLDDKVFIPRAVGSEISRAKDKLLTPGVFARQSVGDYRLERIAAVYEKYQQKLQNANAMDFDDIIVHTVRLLKNCPDVLAYYQKKFRYVLVDEYQDTNMAQFELTNLLAGGYNNLCVVGDDDQSIYRFRGATIENILSFEKHHPGARVIRLEQNYRSTGTILGAANGVIENNAGRRGKKLWTEAGAGEKIAFYSGYNEQDEAQYIASQIIAGYAKGKTPRDYAVLYRINAQSNTIENAMKRNGIPYRIVGGLRFFDRAEVRDMLAYLHAVANHDDTLRITRIINNPARRIGERRVEDALALAAQQGVTLFDILRRAGELGAFDRAAAPMQAFAGMLASLRSLADELPLDQFYDAVLEQTGYLEALEKKADAESLGRIENIRELKTNIVEYMQSHDNPTLDGFLEEIALFTDIDRYDAGADAAVMMTIHSAKGLEFPEVFIAGMEEGIFPSYRVQEDEKEAEEERRLCYVAITRAKKRLHITCARRRMIFGRITENPPSRFIDEIPADYIDRPVPEQESASSAIPGGVGTVKPGMNPAAPRAAGAGGSGFGSTRRAAPPARPPRPGTPGHSSAPMPPKPSKAPPFAVGERIRHRAFGTGSVTALHPMGGDVLLTIEFEKSGTKRLMANTAARFMEKESG